MARKHFSSKIKDLLHLILLVTLLLLFANYESERKSNVKEQASATPKMQTYYPAVATFQTRIKK